MRLPIMVVLCALAAPAYADDDSVAAKALLDAQVKAINAGDAKAFAATFSENGSVILPTVADEGVDETSIAAASKHWLGTVGKTAVKLENVHIADDHQVAPGTWFDADLVGTNARWRISGLVLKTLVEKNGEQVEGPHKIVAAHYSEAADDKAVLAAAAAGTLPALPAFVGNDKDLEPDPGKIATFAKRVYKHKSVSLIGSAAKEKAVGKAAVAKLLAGWKSLKLKTLAYLRESDEAAAWGFEWCIGHVEATFTVKGKPVKVPYRALVIIYVPSAVEQDHGAKSELLHAHYSVATH